jgi:hypothetical protein
VMFDLELSLALRTDINYITHATGLANGQPGQSGGKDQSGESNALKGTGPAP